MSKRDKIRKLRRKRLEKVSADMPELTEIPKRQPNGKRRQTSVAPADPRKTALQARCRQFGREDTRDARKAVSGPHSGFQIGMVLEYLAAKDQIAPLWQTFQAWCMAEATYRHRYLGRAETPQGPALKFMREVMEADQSATVDLRDSEQKDRDAVNNWMRWQGYLGHLTRDHQIAMHDARLERVELWCDCRPTKRGAISLAALAKLHEVVGR